ncbi:unnamed protein product [Rotaria sp. Silwood2]|nr:unnamed protein product [Rotaria sp. Silwood2]CAF2990637.1 unnamed protein product [Rotaria sp. Silwood2]CAF4201240.1 unnamed protein product [Rotaria sp. Silwood2]CAF4302617.1 unnamed protein product [Rotaria sp. Silwood2]CAF4401851.1 unnamed protein product [Rotaria sp. Silwood2]
MSTKNLQPIIISRYKLSYIWDCVDKVSRINSEAILPENSLMTFTNEQKCSNRSSYEPSTTTYTDHSNYSLNENGISTSKLHLTLRTQQDDNSIEQDTVKDIGNHGQWYCQHCDKLRHAKKKIYLLELPPVLILQLKRFNNDLRSFSKIDTLIEYDLDDLDLNTYVVPSRQDKSIRYKLTAVSNHWGRFIDGGHFVTYAKLPTTQDWYKYNDDRVGKMDKSIHVNNYSAYTLVYQQEKKDLIIDTAV